MVQILFNYTPLSFITCLITFVVINLSDDNTGYNKKFFNNSIKSITIIIALIMIRIFTYFFVLNTLPHFN